MEEYEHEYACEYCGAGFSEEGLYNNETCDDCAVEHGLLD